MTHILPADATYRRRKKSEPPYTFAFCGAESPQGSGHVNVSMFINNPRLKSVWCWGCFDALSKRGILDVVDSDLLAKAVVVFRG